jgi:hypothetical protein
VDAVDGAIWAAAISVILFVVQYTLSSPWWRDPVGRTVVLKDLAVLVLLLQICLLFLWPHLLTMTGELVLDLGSLVGVTLVMLWRMAVWYRIKPPTVLRRLPPGEAPPVPREQPRHARPEHPQWPEVPDVPAD